MTMMTPTIHLNGTSQRELMEQQRAALTALRLAHYAVSAAAPHGRDYYVQGYGDAAINAALAEHRERLLKIETVIKDIEEIAAAILNQKAVP